MGLGLDVFSGNNNLRQKMFDHYKSMLSPHVASVSKDYWKKQMEILNWNLTCYMNDDFQKMKNLIFLKVILYENSCQISSQRGSRKVFQKI